MEMKGNVFNSLIGDAATYCKYTIWFVLYERTKFRMPLLARHYFYDDEPGRARQLTKHIYQRLSCAIPGISATWVRRARGLSLHCTCGR